MNAANEYYRVNICVVSINSVGKLGMIKTGMAFGCAIMLVASAAKSQDIMGFLRDDPISEAFLEGAALSAQCLGIMAGIVPKVYEALQIAADHKMLGVLENSIEISMYKKMTGERGRHYEMKFEYPEYPRYRFGDIAENSGLYLALLSGYHARLMQEINIGNVPEAHVDLYKRRVGMGFAMGVGPTMTGLPSMIHNAYSQCPIPKSSGTAYASWADPWFEKWIKDMDLLSNDLAKIAD